MNATVANSSDWRSVRWSPVYASAIATCAIVCSVAGALLGDYMGRAQAYYHHLHERFRTRRVASRGQVAPKAPTGTLQ